MAGCKDVTSLSPLSEQVLKRLSPQSMMKSGSMFPAESTSEDTLTTTSPTLPLLHTVKKEVKVTSEATAIRCRYCQVIQPHTMMNMDLFHELHIIC